MEKDLLEKAAGGLIGAPALIAIVITELHSIFIYKGQRLFLTPFVAEVDGNRTPLASGRVVKS